MAMRTAKTVFLVGTIALLGAMLAPAVRAQDDNAYLKRTRVTFTQPVEIPGQVLPAGTYTLELLDMANYRHIVRFFNADRSRVVTTVLAIPNYRLETTDKTVITFEERPIDSPEALKAWFYPGDNFGQEFVYPKKRAMELAQVTHEPVLAAPTETTDVEELKVAPLVAVTPEMKELPIGEVVQTAPLVAETRAAQELPRTASPIPMIIVLSAASLAIAFVVRRFATQRS
jgi:hypothetical protein